MSRWRHPVSHYVGVGLAILTCAIVAVALFGGLAVGVSLVLRALGVIA